jgi:hypothetical protein
MAQQDDLTRALLHLEAAKRLLREVFALRAVIAVGRAIRLTEALLSQQRPLQPRLALEADDDPIARPFDESGRAYR